MAANAFLYHRATDRLTAGSWAVATGTPRTGYPVTNLDDQDPSNPFWITGTSARVTRNFGSAQRVDHVYLFAHTLVNAADLRVQMNASDSWGSPTVNIPVTIPAEYEDGFSYHLHADVAAAYPTVGDRTKQYLSIANLSANPVSVAIGDVAMFASGRTLERHLRWGFVQSRQRLTSRVTSKRGVSTVYDYGSIQRQLSGSIPATEQDYLDLLALEADARGSARPFVIVLSPGDALNRWAEPMPVRLSSPISAAPYEFPSYIPVTFQVEEVGRGELLGA